MASETGHAKNLANFNELITLVKSFEEQYNPIADNLKIAALEAQAKKAEEVLSKLKEAETVSKQATATLQSEFKTLNTFTSRIMGLLISSGAKSSSIDEARSIQKKIVGNNTKKKKTDTQEASPTETKETRSTSRQSYDSRLDSFEKLVTVLQNIPEYTPFEDEFKIKALQFKIKAMKEAIQTNDNKEALRSQMMTERNNLLYTDDIGLVSVANKIKAYIKAIFGGVKSTQYKTASKIRFTKQRT